MPVFREFRDRVMARFVDDDDEFVDEEVPRNDTFVRFMELCDGPVPPPRLIACFDLTRTPPDAFDAEDEEDRSITESSSDSESSPELEEQRSSMPSSSCSPMAMDCASLSFQVASEAPCVWQRGWGWGWRWRW